MLARADRPASWHPFRKALDSDIADIQGGTTPEGIHCGAMAAMVDLVRRCYLGIGMRVNVLFFDPALLFDPALPTTSPPSMSCCQCPAANVLLRDRRQLPEPGTRP